MKRKLISCLALVVLLIASYAPSAQADSEYPSYVYLAEDPIKQDPLTLGLDNFVLAWWWANLTPTWWAEAGIASDAQNAINSWKNLIPQLTYTPNPAPDENGAIIRLYYRPCPQRPDDVSCYIVKNTFYIPDEAATYIMDAEIYINNSNTLQWNSTVRTLAIAHELGQRYGLHERMMTIPNACNPDELTVMDMLPVVNGQVTLCNPALVGPTALDKQRVDAFWSGGSPLLANLPISGWGNVSVATYRWHDLAWAELLHYLDFQYKNANGDWITFISGWPQAFIGVHMYTQDRAMGAVIDISQEQFLNVPGGEHRACGWAYFAAYNKYGNGQCSMPVTLEK